MNCPECGHHYQSPQEAWQERQKAQGRCIICGVECDKWPADTKRAGEFYLRCPVHRARCNEDSNKRYHQRTKRQFLAQRFK